MICQYGTQFENQQINISELMQKRHNPIADALELRLFCIKPSPSWFFYVLVMQNFQNPTLQFRDFIPHKHVPYHVSWWCDEHGHTFFVKGIHWYTVTLNSPRKWPIMWSFGVSFVASLKKLMKKQLNCKEFQMPWYSCDITVMETHHPKPQI